MDAPSCCSGYRYWLNWPDLWPGTASFWSCRRGTVRQYGALEGERGDRRRCERPRRRLLGTAVRSDSDARAQAGATSGADGGGDRRGDCERARRRRQRRRRRRGVGGRRRRLRAFLAWRLRPFCLPLYG